MEFLCPSCQKRTQLTEVYRAEIYALVEKVENGEVTECDWGADDVHPTETLYFECMGCGHRETELERFPECR